MKQLSFLKPWWHTCYLFCYLQKQGKEELNPLKVGGNNIHFFWLDNLSYEILLLHWAKSNEISWEREPGLQSFIIPKSNNNYLPKLKQKPVPLSPNWEKKVLLCQNIFAASWKEVENLCRICPPRYKRPCGQTALAWWGWRCLNSTPVSACRDSTSLLLEARIFPAVTNTPRLAHSERRSYKDNPISSDKQHGDVPLGWLKRSKQMHGFTKRVTMSDVLKIFCIARFFPHISLSQTRCNSLIQFSNLCDGDPARYVTVWFYHSMITLIRNSTVSRYRHMNASKMSNCTILGGSKLHIFYHQTNSFLFFQYHL